MRKCMMNSEQLINDLREILISNFDKLKLEVTEHGTAIIEAVKGAATGTSNREKVELDLAKREVVDRFLSEYVMNFNVELPRPNSVTLENQLIALETYTKALDATLDSYLSDTFFTSETGGEVANQVSMAKEVVKAYYIRQWMTENGVMTELANLTNLGPDGKPVVDIFEIQTGHIENLTKTLTKFMVGLQPVKDAADIVLANRVGEMEPAPDTSSDDGGDGSSSSDDMGGGEFDMGGGIPGLDEAPTDEQPAGDGNEAQPTEGEETGTGETKDEGTEKSKSDDNPEGIDPNAEAKPE